MDNIQILIGFISTLWFITTGLVVYIFKEKDGKIKDIAESLNEIKSLVHSVNLNLNSVKIELDNNIYNTRKLDEAMTKQIDITAALKIAETKISGRLLAVEKSLNQLEKHQ